MRVLFLGNNRVGWELAGWLRSQGEEIVGLIAHPEGRRRFGDELIRAADLPADRVFDGSRLREPGVLVDIAALQAEIGVSAFFGYIVGPDFLELVPAGCVNVHPALLPYNRGAYPNVWSIVDRTPAGATVHYIDAGIDTGDIVAQREIRVEPVDTGETLYRRLERTCVELFQEVWPAIRSRRATRHPQAAGEGTFHQTRDVEAIDRIDLDARVTAGRLIDILRARTFPPHPGAYFVNQGRRVYLRVELLDEDALAEERRGEGH